MLIFRHLRQFPGDFIHFILHEFGAFEQVKAEVGGQECHVGIGFTDFDPASGKVRPGGSYFQPARRIRPSQIRALEFQSPICQHQVMESPASIFKLRANAPEGRKAICHQLKIMNGMGFAILL